jgi:sulfide:quinone oxidoreductase
MIQNMTSGVAVFTNPSTPIKCGGAPHKIMYLACDYWRKKGVLKNISVHYVSGGGVLFGVKEYLATLQEVVQKNEIITHYGANTTRIDGENQVLYFTKTEADGSVKEHSMKFNFLHAVAPQSAPEFIKSSPLRDQSNPHGYINIDKSTMQHVEFKNIFALGDATNAPCSKTGAAIRKQAPVVVENLLSFLNHQSPKAVYTGYSACPIPTQYGKLMLAEFDYTNTPTMTFPFNQAKPRWSMWILKKYILPWLYWNKILKGKA